MRTGADSSSSPVVISTSFEIVGVAAAAAALRASSRA